MKSIIFTHKGKREVNQDFVLRKKINPSTLLFLIADGMGGYEHGAIAAKVAAENIHTYLSTVKVIDSKQLQNAINKANLAIRQIKDNLQEKLGATIGGLILTKSQAICFWVGDVKIFHFRNNRLFTESRSHTLINEVIENGSINDAKRLSKFRHVVTRSIQGEVEKSQLDFFKIDSIYKNDMFVICSDGVHDLADGIYLQQIINTSETFDKAIKRIEKRLKEEAKDNFSLICCFNELENTTTILS